MAERNVSVKLSANVSSYLAAMAKAKAATTGLSTGGARDLTQLGGAMQSVGRTATLGVTVPLLALGAGAVSMAAKFDTAFAQMVGLANVPAAEVDNLKESVLALAGETAVAPQELAEGLYFAASAGLDSAAAMEVLEMAARASASGMGTTADVVNLVSGAIAAYGEDNITAAEATDILTAAIREGKAEPSEFAGALGRITPIAASMGIEFGEVAGAAAFMSNILGDTDETITALRGALLAMIDPSEQGRKTLEDMGTSFAELQGAIARDGLLGALELLREHGFVGNSEAMSNLFEDNRALVGATILLEDATGRLVPTIDAVTNSAGAAGEAFSTIAGTDGFKLKQALTDIKVAMIQVGDVLLPIAADIASAISGLTGWFSDLSPAVQEVVVAVAGIAAAAGPAIFVAGSLIKNWQAVSGAFTNAGSTATMMGKTLGVIGIAAAVGFVAFQAFTAEQQKTDEVTRDVSEALLIQFQAFFAAGDAAAFTAGEINGVTIAQQALSQALAEGHEDLADSLAALNIGAEDTLAILTTFATSPITAIDNLARSFGFTAEQADRIAHINFDSFGVWRGQAERLSDELGISVEQFLAFGDAYVAFRNAADNAELQDIARDFLNNRVELEGYEGSLVAAAEATLGFDRTTGDAMAVLMQWAIEVAGADESTRTAALGAEGYEAALAGLPPELQAILEGTEGAVGATEELEGVQASSIDTMSRYQGYLEDVAHILGEYSSAVGDAVAPHRNLENAIDDVWASFSEMGDNIDETDRTLSRSTEGGRTNREVLQGMADDLIELAQRRLEDGQSIDSVNNDLRANREQLLDTAEAAGFNRDEVATMIDEYGLVPDLITTSIEIANDALAKWRIDRYLEKLDTIDPTIATAIELAIDAGDWAEANRLLQSIPDPEVNLRVRVTPVRVNVSNGQVTYNTGGSYVATASGRFVRGGTNLLSTLGEVGGSRGDEVVLPLGDPGRMAALLGMSEVGPRVAAALGNLMPAPSHSGSGQATAASGGDTFYVTVHNNGRDLTGDDVARAIGQARWS